METLESNEFPPTPPDMPGRHEDVASQSLPKLPSLGIEVVAIPPNNSGRGLEASPPSSLSFTSKPLRSPRLSPEEKDIRRDMMLIKKIEGNRLPDIAAQFHLSINQARDILSDARRSEIITKSKDLLTGMIPKALAVVDASLDAGDKDIALEVLKAVGVIGKPWEITNAGAGSIEESFELFRARITRAPSGPASGQASGGPIIDVTPIATPPDAAGDRPSGGSREGDPGDDTQ